MSLYPIFIICRDRLTCTLQLIDWLERAGQSRIYLVDNESTYEPLLEYYETTPHQVIKLGGNTGHTGIWNLGVIEREAPNEFFVVSDPDVVPSEEAPLDSLDYFRYILDRYDDRQKAGFGLRIDDIPDCYKLKQSVIDYEKNFWNYGGPEPGLHFAPIDTTFALYRPGATQDISFACRTSFPYVARHLSWYVDSENLTDEEKHYRLHANHRISSWNHDELPFWLGGNR